LGVTAAVLACGASRADAFVYFSAVAGHSGANTIGRAELDGSNPDRKFITSAGSPYQLEVDGAHIYWVSPRSIGRANLDGTDPDPSFIKLAETPGSGDLAVNAGHIYWISHSAGTGIGRANLDGTGVEQNFIPVSGAGFLAVDDQHIYWSENGFFGDHNHEIVRANLDGTDRHTIVAIYDSHRGPGYMAVDAAHLYWTYAGDNEIARAGLDGSALEDHFLTGVAIAYGGLLAVGDSNMYYGGRGTLGRVGLDGSGRIPGLITGTQLTGLTVDGLRGPAGPPLRSARIAANGAVRLPPPWITCPSAAPACTVTVQARAPLTGRRAATPIGRTTFPVAAGRTVTAHFRLSTTGRQALKRLRRLKTTITITTRHGARVTTRTVLTTLKAPAR
jgi:hypothetical protein